MRDCGGGTDFGDRKDALGPQALQSMATSLSPAPTLMDLNVLRYLCLNQNLLRNCQLEMPG